MFGITNGQFAEIYLFLFSSHGHEQIAYSFYAVIITSLIWNQSFLWYEDYISLPLVDSSRGKLISESVGASLMFQLDWLNYAIGHWSKSTLWLIPILQHLWRNHFCCTLQFWSSSSLSPCSVDSLHVITIEQGFLSIWVLKSAKGK